MRYIIIANLIIFGSEFNGFLFLKEEQDGLDDARRDQHTLKHSVVLKLLQYFNVQKNVKGYDYKSYTAILFHLACFETSL